MQLTTNIDIDGGIITASIKCTDISEDTREALHDYTKVLRYSDLDFSAKIKVTNNMPEIVSEDDPDGEKVKIGLVDKSFIVDENLYLELKLDSAKMSNKELTSWTRQKKKKKLLLVSVQKPRKIVCMYKD